MFFIVCTWLSLCLATRCRAVDLAERVLPLTLGDLCYMIYHKSSISGDRLYFMGGLFTFEAGEPSTPQNQLYWLDLNSTLPIDTIIPGSSLQSTTVPGSEWDTWQGRGTFLTDASMDTIYFTFNVLSSNISTNTLEAFNTTSQTWSNVSVIDKDHNSSKVPYDPIGAYLSSSATTSTSGLGLGFTIGGDYTRAPSGMIVLDASNPDSLSWTTETDGVPILSGAEMQYARYGNKGVLIAFGGYSTPLNQLYDMSQIFVYDIDSIEWFNVTAGGDVPGPRSEFCTTISAAPDDSSFQITIYGGKNFDAKRCYEQVYVLSIPSFQWILISDQGNREALLDQEEIGRMGHTCNLYGDRQMIVLGGNITSGGNPINTESCNTSWAALRVLDTTTFVWQTQFNRAQIDYAVPDQVYSIIGGSVSGNATMKAPPGGFNDSALTEIFQKTIPKFELNTTSTAPDTPAPPSSSSKTTAGQSAASKPSSPTPAGSIAGSLVGGVAALVIAGGMAYVFYVRRQRKRGQVVAANPSELPSDTSSNRHNAQEVHGDHRPNEIDGNVLLEIDGRLYVEAPDGVLASSVDLPKTP